MKQVYLDFRYKFLNSCCECPYAFPELSKTKDCNCLMTLMSFKTFESREQKDFFQQNNGIDALCFNRFSRVINDEEL